MAGLIDHQMLADFIACDLKFKASLYKEHHKIFVQDLVELSFCRFDGSQDNLEFIQEYSRRTKVACKMFGAWLLEENLGALEAAAASRNLDECKKIFYSVVLSVPRTLADLHFRSSVVFDDARSRMIV